MDHDLVSELATLSHDAGRVLARLAAVVDDEAAALYRMNPASNAFERREYASSILREAIEAADRAKDFIDIARGL